VWEDEEPGLTDSMRRRAGAAVTGLRRRLSSSRPASPGVPFFINLLADAELWPKTGRVGEQRLLLVQYWRQMQREMTKESAEPVEPQAVVADTAPVEQAIPVSPPPSASVGSILLSPPKALPTYEELNHDDADDCVVVAAKAEPEPAAAPEPPPAAAAPEPPRATAAAPDVLGARASWVPASVLFAKQPEEATAAESTAEAGPDELIEAAEPPAAPLLLDAEAVPQAEAPAPAEDPSDAPLLADEEPQPAAVEPAPQPTVAEVEHVVMPDTVEPPVTEPVEAPVASDEPDVVLPLIEMPAATADVVPDLEADEVVEIAFSEPAATAAVPLPVLPHLDEDVAIDAPGSMSLEVPATSLPRLEVPAMSDGLLTERDNETLGDLPVDHGADRIDAWSAELLVETSLRATAPEGTETPGPAASPLKTLAVDELVARAGEAFTLDVPVPMAELAAPDVGAALFVDERSGAIPEAPEARLEPAALEMPSFIAEDAAAFVGAMDDVSVDMPVPDVEVDAALTASAAVALEQATETFDDVELPAPPPAAAFDVPVVPDVPVEEPVAEAFAADPAFEESMVAGVGEVAADPQADEARDTRLRRAGIIPMPATKAAAVAEATSRGALPALERFLRSAQARRRQVDESVA